MIKFEVGKVYKGQHEGRVFAHKVVSRTAQTVCIYRGLADADEPRKASIRVVDDVETVWPYGWDIKPAVLRADSQ
jgi:hypothetical protein